MPRFLLLEQIEIRGPGASLFEDFGRDLARLHREARSERCSFESADFLGASYRAGCLAILRQLA